MTVPMALMDFVPVLFFGAAWVILYRDLRNKLDLCSGILLPLGALTVLLAGLFKAVWKLQNAIGATPTELFNRAFFPAQSLGFVLLGVGMLASMHWVAQSVNFLGEGMLFLGALLLHRAGLADRDALNKGA